MDDAPTTDTTDAQLLAELQALQRRLDAADREDRIRAAVGGVLQRALAMKTHEDIAGVVEATGDALVDLGLDYAHASIAVLDPERDLAYNWVGWSGDRVNVRRGYRYSLSSLRRARCELFRPRRGRQRVSVRRFTKRQFSVELRKIHRAQPPGGPDWRVDGAVARMVFPNFHHLFYFSGGFIAVDAPAELDSDQVAVGRRLADAFDLAYRRFVELRAAQRRARDAEVEAALERVRARAQGMQSSAEFGEVTQRLVQEMQGLGSHLVVGMFAVMDAEDHDSWLEVAAGFGWAGEPWRCGLQGSSQGLFQRSFVETYEAWARGDAWYVFEIPEEGFHDYRVHNSLGFGNTKREALRWARRRPRGVDVFHHRIFHRHGFLNLVHHSQPLSDEVLEVGRRFAQIFEYAYDRFRELEAKEAQNRELTVQNALERVRARALGMQESHELGEVVWDLHEEVCALGVDLSSTRICLWDTDGGREAWLASQVITRDEGPAMLPAGHRAPRLAEMRRCLEAGEPWHVFKIPASVIADRLRMPVGQLLRERGLSDRQIERRLGRMPVDLWNHRVFFSAGYVAFIAAHELAEPDLELLKRSTDVFDFAYQRFRELEQKEAQNRQLRLNAAVERVRAEAGAMRAADDIAKLLTALDEGLRAAGVPASILALNVHDPDADRFTSHIHTVEGTVPIQLPEDRILWRQPDTGVIVARTEVAPSAYENRGWHIRPAASAQITGGYSKERLKDVSRMWGVTIPEGVMPDTVAFVPFAYGELSLQCLPDEPRFTQDDLDTVAPFADAVSLGYARYLDFRALEEANAEIQEATRLKSQFLATMSHELRTPMNAIIGFTRLVQRRADNLTERQRGNLDKVGLSASHLLALINDILDLSKVEAGRVDLKPSAFDLPPLLEQCCATVGPTLGKATVELTCDIAAGVGQVHADQDRLRQVVINLLSNALKFTDKGRVTVGALPAPLVVGDEVEPGVRIAVADSGIGIPPDKLQTVFEEFRQVDGSSTRRHQGTGLGLAITRRLVELMGGTIGVESQAGVGSTFTVHLPVRGRGAGGTNREGTP